MGSPFVGISYAVTSVDLGAAIRVVETRVTAEATASSTATSGVVTNPFGPASDQPDGSVVTDWATGGFSSWSGPSSNSSGGYGAVAHRGGVLVTGSTYRDSTNVCMVLRYTAAGVLDASFGTGGVIEPFGANASHYCGDSVVASDGSIFVLNDSGGSSASAAVARLSASGALDASFGTGGVQALPGLKGEDIALAGDGGIVVAGNEQASPYSMAMQKLTVAGELDASFGVGGSVGAQVGDSAQGAESLSVASDGTIVVASRVSTTGDPIHRASVTRFTADGVLDASFGTGGTTELPALSASAESRSTAIAPDGSVYLLADAGPRVVVARMDDEGVLDASFGAGGVTVLDEAAGGAYSNSIELQPDGKVLIAGANAGTAQGLPYLWRLTVGGDPDPVFGVGGRVAISNAGGDTQVRGMVVDGGELYLAGRDYVASDVNAFLGKLRIAAPPRIVTAVTLAGQARIGQTITAVRATFDPQGRDVTSSPLEWQRCSDGTCAAVAGATGLAYVVTTADVGSSLRVVDSSTTWAGTTRSAAQSDVVPAAQTVTAPEPEPEPEPERDVSNVKRPVRTITLAQLRRLGISASVTCRVRCASRARVTIPRAVAVRLGLVARTSASRAPVRLGASKLSRTEAGVQRTTVRLPRRTLARLAVATRVTFTYVLTVTVRGKQTTSRYTVRLQ